MPKQSTYHFYGGILVNELHRYRMPELVRGETVELLVAVLDLMLYRPSVEGIPEGCLFEWQ